MMIITNEHKITAIASGKWNLRRKPNPRLPSPLRRGSAHRYQHYQSYDGSGTSVLRERRAIMPGRPFDAAMTRGDEALPYHLLVGSVVKDAERMMQIVSRGGGTMAMKPAVDQALVHVE